MEIGVMAGFIEKFHVSPKEYKYKLSAPMITLMLLDNSKVIYGKLKKFSDDDMSEAKRMNSGMKVTTFTLDQLIN